MAAREFRFVPFGSRAEARTIACDGLVDGSSLHLSHWGGNRTPSRYKADTSVEIALRYLDDADAETARWPATNNHFDTDGALTVWALLYPDEARRHAALITAAAEAGDFEEWPDDDRGVRLDLALSAVARGADDVASYERALAEIPRLLSDLDAARPLWSDGWERLVAAEQRALAGEATFERHGRMVVVRHREGVAELPAPVVSRRVTRDCTRVLYAFNEGSGRWRYRYERPRWAWADTVVRPAVRSPGRNALASHLGASWALKGHPNSATIVRVDTPIALALDALVERLLTHDPDARR